MRFTHVIRYCFAIHSIRHHCFGNGSRIIEPMNCSPEQERAVYLYVMQYRCLRSKAKEMNCSPEQEIIA